MKTTLEDRRTYYSDYSVWTEHGDLIGGASTGSECVGIIRKHHKEKSDVNCWAPLFNLPVSMDTTYETVEMGTKGEAIMLCMERHEITERYKATAEGTGKREYLNALQKTRELLKEKTFELLNELQEDEYKFIQDEIRANRYMEETK